LVGDRQDREACGSASQAANSSTNLELAKAIGIETSYFEGNQDRMRYPEFRQKKLFVGSGVIGVCGANAIIALRCGCISGKFEDYWEARTA